MAHLTQVARVSRVDYLLIVSKNNRGVKYLMCIDHSVRNGIHCTLPSRSRVMQRIFRR
jgi:hypothetical protein